MCRSVQRPAGQAGLQFEDVLEGQSIWTEGENLSLNLAPYFHQLI